ncbi:hypothetical protein F8568_044030 [Actinomadura sp. LD22]|uniref:Uncharacterized protein n=1 Tax=Actinomadura physcomitrii TaxID=2650748 RepID=A0A6I4MNA9_9ACTN|nr:hypothetical protein [Actinomadura physcomitrii]MWA07193.1 hypothetical protein [Actinomadura physcomitrii]
MIVLTSEKPTLDLQALVSPPLHAAGNDVFDAEDRLLLRVREPVLISVPGEPERLLGIDAATPVWWTEIHIAAASAEARHLAQRCTETLDGTTWADR